MVPFFTLGAASYLDAGGRRRPSYEERASRDNPLLRTHFSWLYERLRTAIGDHLGEPVDFHAAFALPGFHVFERCMIFERSFASMHRDLQYRALDWTGDEPDFDRPISFTVPMAMPSAGAGLELWDLHAADLDGLSDAEVTARAAAETPVYHPYRLGVVNLHSGHQLHRIAPMAFGDDVSERMTLQGHGVRCGGTWRLYW